MAVPEVLGLCVLLILTGHASSHGSSTKSSSASSAQKLDIVHLLSNRIRGEDLPLAIHYFGALDWNGLLCARTGADVG